MILTIATAIVSIYAFEEVRKAERVIAEQTQPATRTANAIKSGVATIVAMLPRIGASLSEDALEQIRLEVRRESSKIENLLTELTTLTEIERGRYDIRAILSAFEAGLERQISGRILELEISEQRRRVISDTVIALQKLSDAVTPEIVRANEAIQRIGATSNNVDVPGDVLRNAIRRVLNLNEARARARSIIATILTLEDATTRTAIERSKADLSLNLRILTRLALETQTPSLKASLGEGLAGTVSATSGENGAVELSNKLVAVRQDARSAYSESLATGEKLRSASTEFIEFADQLALATARDTQRAIRNGEWFVIGIAVVAIVTALLIMWLYAYRSVLRRLSALIDTTRALAGGNLDTPVPDLGTDEIGEMGTVLDLFKQNAQQILQQERALSQANRELERSNEDLQLSQQRTEVVTQRLSDAIESIPNGLLLWGADHVLVLANRQFGEIRPDLKDFIAGKPTYEELARQSINARMPDASPAEIEAEIQRGMALHEVGNSRDQFQLPSGDWIQVEVRRTAEGGYVAVYSDITELVSARDQLDTAISSMDNGFLLWDPDDRLVQWNESFLGNRPYLKEILVVGTTLREFITRVTTGRDPDAGDAEIESAMELYRQPSFAVERQLPNGDWSLIRLERTADNHKVVSIMDITEQKQARQRLEDSLEAIPNAFQLWGGDGKLVYVNSRYRELRPDVAALLNDDISFDEFGKLAIAARMRGADSDAIEEEFVAQGQSLDGEAHQTPDGRWLLRSVRPTQDNGRVIVLTDITELVAARNQLTAAVESMESGFLLWSADGRLIICNRRQLQIRPEMASVLVPGSTIDDYIEKSARLALPDAPEEVIQEAIAARAAEYDQPSTSYERKLPTGEWHLVKAERTRDGETVVLVTDVTDLKRAQERLEQQATELKRSNEELEQFAYLASHDLQEPLRVVASYCDLLKKRYADKIDDDGREFLEFAVDGAQRMRSLIDDLLTYSRAGRGAIDWEPVDLSGVIEDAKTALWSQIEETGAVVTSDDLPQVAGSHRLITQVFQNLISNAIKFRSDATPTIHISAMRDNGHFKIQLVDNGIGIEAKFAERVFRMFQRLHNREDYSGNGLGLALCQRVVHRHGGEIWVEPSTSAGTTICFTLPTVKTIEITEQVKLES